ncbi:Polygalacturonase [Pseudomonas brassicacearum]
MPAVFRYSSKKYNDSLLALGNVRIGTLHDFRRTEHKLGIADVNEGKKKVWHHIPYADTQAGDGIHVSALKEFGIIDLRLGSNVIFDNCVAVQDFNHPDCFVHCTSFDYSCGAMRQFEDADSCVEIPDAVAFYKRLTLTLHNIIPVRLLTLTRVKYMERHEDWNGKNWGIHPALIKEPNFAPQVEVRAIWIPLFSGAISPVIMNDIGLIPLCKSRSVPEHFRRKR